MPEDTWHPCSACKKPIAYGDTYYTCSVSTCNRARTALHFCTVSCWEVHLPVARHREAWAEEQTAPSRQQAAREAQAKEAKEAKAAKAAKPGTGAGASASRAPRRIVPEAKPATPKPGDVPEEVLIVASRLKDYVRAISGFNTSERVLGPLSEIVRRACAEAVQNARAEGRKTILDRDVPKA